MTRFGIASVAVTMIVAGAGGWLWFSQPEPRPAIDQRSASKHVPEEPAPASGADKRPTLYCEFTNFADRTPLVGFYFLIETTTTPPVYALIFQREKDGSQADFGEGNTPRPAWRLDGSDSPAVLRSPDEAIAINLYDDDTGHHGAAWFEAGLRSIQYKNLGGKCRRSGV